MQFFSIFKVLFNWIYHSKDLGEEKSNFDSSFRGNIQCISVLYRLIYGATN